MRISAFMVIGPGETERYLQQVLTQLHWCDTVYLVLNNVPEWEKAKIKDWCWEMPVMTMSVDNREWGKNQHRIKADNQREMRRVHKPDWVWCLDSDEVFPTFTRELAEQMASGHEVAWHFWCIQLWNAPDRVREDHCFPNVRYYKVLEGIPDHYHQQPLHCGLAPEYAYKMATESGQPFLHYGLMTKEERERKIARYAKYDPDGKYKDKKWYKSLAYHDAPTKPLDEVLSKLPSMIRRDKAWTMPKSDPTKVRFFISPTTGRPYPAEGEAVVQAIKHGHKELDMKQVQTGGEAPVVRKHKTAKVSKKDGLE